jgi:soluble lytic murein transglycosylase-like protein
MLSRASFLSVRLLSLVLVLCLGCVIAVAQKQLHINDSDVSFGEMGRSENGRGDSQGGTTSRAKVGTKGSLQRLSGNKAQAEIRLEQTIYKAIYKESARFKIDPYLVCAVVWQESSFMPGAVSIKKARGLMQLMPETAARFNVLNPHDPEESIRGGVAYLVWLLDRFGGNVALALAGYNAGPASVEAYLYGKTIVLSNGKVINRRGIRNDGIPPYAETINYVQKVAERYRLLRLSREVKVLEVSL